MASQQPSLKPSCIDSALRIDFDHTPPSTMQMDTVAVANIRTKTEVEQDST